MNQLTPAIRREFRVAFSRHAQPAWFRIIKWTCLFTGLVLFYDQSWFWRTVTALAITGTLIHFFYRWKTKSWTRRLGWLERFGGGARLIPQHAKFICIAKSSSPLTTARRIKASCRRSRNWPKSLARSCLLLHVADGWAARAFDQLKLAESEEMKADRAYLEKSAKHLRDEGVAVSTMLALGNPPAEIIKVAEAEDCKLIAMTSHGHRLLGDVLHGSTINEVRHGTHIPIFLVRAEKK